VEQLGFALSQPHRLFMRTVYHSLNPYLINRTLGVTLMFGAMTFVIYVMFVGLGRASSTLTPARPARVNVTEHAPHQHRLETEILHRPPQHAHAQAAMMTLRPGQSSSDEPVNEHPRCEQWLFVIAGAGRAPLANGASR
jgi:hypothetical protein